MPPKGWRKTASGFQPTNSSGVNIKDRKVHGIEDLLLPRTVVAKIAKQVLPENSPLPRDGVTALMRSVTMFTSYITAEANNIARQEYRKTVTHTDILRALEVCHFGSFINATKELSEHVLTKSKTPKEDAEMPDSAGPTEGGANEEDDEDFYIEEDVEPEADQSINSVQTEKEPKRLKSSEGDVEMTS